MPPAQEQPTIVTTRMPQNAPQDPMAAPSTAETIRHPQTTMAFNLSRAPMVPPLEVGRDAPAVSDGSGWLAISAALGVADKSRDPG